MNTQHQQSRPRKPLELRHLSATKLLDPEDLGIVHDFGADVGVDVGEESIPNYDQWDAETDSLHGVPAGKDANTGSNGGGSNRSSAESLSRSGGKRPPPAAAAGAAEEAQRRPSSSSHHSDTNGHTHDAGAASSRGSSRTSVAPAAETRQQPGSPSTSMPSINTGSPKPGIPSYRPQAGPVVYKQLDFDDEHDDGGDIIVMGESDIDMHSPTSERGPHDWAGREGAKERGGWFARRLWGMMQMICAAPSSK
ncbi:hypothetical protein HDU89_004575 [Geranomyces variabilis]|nr:hypothetical protein HDU89_004575 [Geranomyces variabilis]